MNLHTPFSPRVTKLAWLIGSILAAATAPATVLAAEADEGANLLVFQQAQATSGHVPAAQPLAVADAAPPRNTVQGPTSTAQPAAPAATADPDADDGVLTFTPSSGPVRRQAAAPPKVPVSSPPATVIPLEVTAAEWQPPAHPSSVAAPTRPLDLTVPTMSAEAMGREVPWVSGVTSSEAGQELRMLTFIRDMVGSALSLSPELRQASANWHAAEGDADQLRGQRWPQVVMGASSPSYSVGPNSTSNSDGRVNSSIQVVTPIYDFGALRHGIEGQANIAKAQEQALEQTRLTVAYNTVAALVDLTRYQESLQISDTYVARMRQLVEMLSQIAEADPGRGSEVVQARARLLQAETSRDLVQARVQEVQTSLAKLVGREVTIPAGVRWEWTPLSLEQGLSLLPSHPALQQVHWEVESARSTAASVRASRLPKVNWVAGRSTEENVFGHSEPWTTGLSLEWKAFQGGSAAAAQRAASERASAAEQRLEASSREAEYRIRNLVQQRDLARARTSDYDQLLVESDRVRTMFFEQWHQLGKRTLLDVLIAENEYYTHRIAAVTSFYDARVSDLRVRAESGALLEWLKPESARR